MSSIVGIDLLGEDGVFVESPVCSSSDLKTALDILSLYSYRV